jgi:anti-sigma regulatory factor (Ser/Thr protein kinase)
MSQERCFFQLKNCLLEQDTLCSKIKYFGEAVGLSSKDLFQITLALDEIFTNIVTYGFKDAGQHTINFDLSLKNNLLEIRVEDDGSPFNPLSVAPPDLNCPLDQRKVGGLGVLLVRKMMDDIQYHRCCGRNILILKRCLNR